MIATRLLRTASSSLAFGVAATQRLAFLNAPEENVVEMLLMPIRQTPLGTRMVLHLDANVRLHVRPAAGDPPVSLPARERCSILPARTLVLERTEAGWHVEVPPRDDGESRQKTWKSSSWTCLGAARPHFSRRRLRVW